MNTLIVSNSAENTMTSREIAEGYQGHIFPDIAAMSKKELELIVHGLVCKTILIKQEWQFRESFVKSEGEKSECPNITQLFCALEDYRHLAFIADCEIQSVSLRNSKPALGNVYVIEFDDSSVKIGMSISPVARIKSVAGGNQAKKLRDWISPATQSFQKLESNAHQHFSRFRLGGEFFSIGFQEAIEWINSECVKLASSNLHESAA